MICCECVCSDRFLLARFRTKSCKIDKLLCDVPQTSTDVMCYRCDVLYTDVMCYRCDVLRRYGCDAWLFCCLVRVLSRFDRLNNHARAVVWSSIRSGRRLVWPTTNCATSVWHKRDWTCRLSTLIIGVDLFYVDGVSLFCTLTQNNYILKQSKHMHKPLSTNNIKDPCLLKIDIEVELRRGSMTPDNWQA